jgi:hypothetical protein
MSVGAENDSAIRVSSDVWREQRESLVIGTLQLLGRLQINPAQQPYTSPGHSVEVKDVRRYKPGVATHLVVHRFSRRDVRDQPPNQYEERITIDARRAVVAGYFKLNLTQYEADREDMLKLGIRSVQEGLDDKEQQALDVAKTTCLQATEVRNQNELPISDLTDGEQFLMAGGIRSVLSTILEELSVSQRADYSAAVLTHH